MKLKRGLKYSQMKRMRDVDRGSSGSSLNSFSPFSFKVFLVKLDRFRELTVLCQTRERLQ